MILTSNDKELLLSWGHTEKDFGQIEEAMSKTIYEEDGKRVSRKRVLEVMSRTEWLSGISRSAFHFTAMRSGVLFDSSRLFK